MKILTKSFKFCISMGFFCYPAKNIYAKNFSLSGLVKEEERITYLKKFFEPQLENYAEFDKTHLRNLPKDSELTEIKGYITVTPPPKNCFTIRHKENTEDSVVCKKTRLSFSAEDLNKNGTINWLLIGNNPQEDTRLTWKTDYRLGQMLKEPLLGPPPQVNPIVVLSCTMQRTKEGLRRITAEIFGDHAWYMTLPKKEELLPQPDPKSKSNLFIYNKQTSNAPAKKDEKENNKSSSDKKEPIPSIMWQLTELRTYKIPASLISGDSATAPGHLGQCRYRYAEEDKDAVLECHKLNEVRWLFLPLICLKI